MGLARAPVIRNSLVLTNQATNGVGVYVRAPCSPRLANCVVMGTGGGTPGTGIYAGSAVQDGDGNGTATADPGAYEVAAP
jgi:hypothetical protein